jgi:dephospho-CoA kinase
MPLEKKIRKADFVIDNNAGLTQTKKQAECIRRQVWRS